MSSDNLKTAFWENMIRAVEAEPREVKVLRGASGFSHPLVALGVDEPRRRVVIVSGEGDARSAVMAQGDIQATMPSVSVVMVRPVAVNLGLAAKLLNQAIGRVELRQSDLRWLSEHSNEFQDRSKAVVEQFRGQLRQIALSSFSAVPLNLLGVIKDAIQQLALVEIRPAETRVDEGELPVTIPTFNFARLAVLDPVEADRRMGVCSIPLYELSGEEVEQLHTRSNDELARELLRRHDVLQYFFPAADQLALGLLDREPVSVDEILSRLTRTPEMGHPFGPLEVIDATVPINEVVAMLREQDFLVEGETVVEVTSKGRTVRSKVSFKPREGLISKLIQRFSINLDISLKDLFK